MSSISNDPFMKLYNFNLEMFEYRVNKVLEIDTMDPNNQMEYMMAFDSMLSLFRSLFLENGKNKNCYTCQNYLKGIGRSETADEMDCFLDEPFNDYEFLKDKQGNPVLDDQGNKKPLTIRYVLKFIADKFVCHQDPVSLEDIGICNTWMADLKSPYFEKNIRYIVNGLTAIINKAPNP